MPVKYLVTLLKELYGFVIDYMQMLKEFKQIFLTHLVAMEAIEKITEDAFYAELLRMTILFTFDIENALEKKTKKEKKPKINYVRNLLKK